MNYARFPSPGLAAGLPILTTAIVMALAPASSAQRGAQPLRRVTEFAPVDRTAPAPVERAGVTLPPSLTTAARPAIVLTGYWPPTNEAVRRFSTSTRSNPGGWAGGDWEGRGYDVYSYFPEFSDPNCLNCGKGTGNFQVDYQKTRVDFVSLVAPHTPVAVVTLSRGFFDNSWELEMNQYNHSVWFDDYVAPRQPTPAPPDATVPAGTLRLSQLPVQEIASAVNAAALGINAAICFSGNAGGFLSEFVAYFGVWYQSAHRSPALSDWCISAGHVHVGGLVGVSAASAAIDVTLRELIAHLDAAIAATVCQPDALPAQSGSAATLAICGQGMSTGNTADVALEGAPPNSMAYLVVGTLIDNPLFWKGGFIYPYPAMIVLPMRLDARGRGLLEGVPGGGGPVTVYTQAVYRDTAQPQGWGFSNVVAVQLLP